jgi:hypothetical protein
MVMNLIAYSIENNYYFLLMLIEQVWNWIYAVDQPTTERGIDEIIG